MIICKYNNLFMITIFFCIFTEIMYKLIIL